MKRVSESIVKQDGEWWYVRGDGRARANLHPCKTCNQIFADLPQGKMRFCSADCVRKECLRCGKEYKPKSNRQAYCSLECKRGRIVCEHCGKVFTPKANTAERFCTIACAHNATTPISPMRTLNGFRIIKVAPETPGPRMRYGPNRQDWMYEHCYVLQQKLGRTLKRGERVRHINGRRDDNRPENLELWKGHTRNYNRLRIGSTRISPQGYCLVLVQPDTPGIKKGGWMLEHRYVMQQKLGRALLETEKVHHINGQKDDNRPENLELWHRTHPAGVRAKDIYHCSSCDQKCTVIVGMQFCPLCGSPINDDDLERMQNGRSHRPSAKRTRPPARLRTAGRP